MSKKSNKFLLFAKIRCNTLTLESLINRIWEISAEYSAVMATGIDNKTPYKDFLDAKYVLEIEYKKLRHYMILLQGRRLK